MFYNTRVSEYRPGFIAFPSGFVHEAFRSSQANNTPTNSTETHQSSSKMEEELDGKWRKLDELHREHQRKIQDEELRAELEYVRLGGRVVENNIKAALKPRIDTRSKLTDEEHALLEAWEEYDKAWDRLSLSVKPIKKFIFRKISFTFDDIPWPVLKQYRRIANSDQAATNGDSVNRISVNDLTANAITQFLLHPLREPSKSRREKLRDAILHYHPDKFNRFLYRIIDSDRARVLHGIDVVIRALNELVNAETQ